jgi:hypothetical protein
MPPRMIGAMILGEQALQPAYAVSTASVVGVVIHFGLSVGFALLFIALAQPVSTMRSTDTLLVTGSIYGLVLWLMNFYLVAASFGWPWFAEQTNPLVQFLGHTYFYGWILGMHLSRESLVRPRDMAGVAEYPHSVRVKGRLLVGAEGRSLGRIVDVRIDEHSGRIEGYDLSRGRLMTRGKRAYLPVAEGFVAGDDVVLAPVGRGTAAIGSASQRRRGADVRTHVMIARL